MKTPLRSLVVLALWLAAAGGSGAQVVTVTLSTTFTPQPNYFGSAVAAVGTDKVIIGAFSLSSDRGAAYLFTIGGTLLTTFTNPVPTIDDEFGGSVAAVGSDKVVIGAKRDDQATFDSGVAYLFGTNGNLILTFTNPTPSQSGHFGGTIATVGTDKVLIGSSKNVGASQSVGAAYLYSTNGTLLTTYTNPNPVNYGYFGSSLAALGPDRVLIHGNNNVSGVVYLYNIDGMLLTTITNPAPSNGYGFGDSVATLGSDRVLIGATGNDIGALNAGAAFIYATNGTLLTTLTNPTPANSDLFGLAVAVVGTDKLLVGAYQDDTGATDAGSAYLFSTNGLLLKSIPNPAPTYRGNFGFALTTVGTDKLLIGGLFNQAAYLFNLTGPTAPRLSIERIAGGNVRFSWPLSATGFVLDQTTSFVSLPATNTWSQVPFPYQTNATQISVSVTPAGNQFYRLRQP